MDARFFALMGHAGATVGPTTRARVSFAILVAAIAAALALMQSRVMPGPADFVPVWYGAHALLHGVNPYTTFGPGLAFDYEWHQFYPAPAFLVAIPFGFMTEVQAAVVFAALGSGLLAFAVTRDNWERSWIFLSASFVTAARVAQWSPLIGATVFLPVLGALLVCKPNFGAAILVSTPSTKTVKAALIGGTVLIIVGFVLLPNWPVDWWRGVQTGTHLNAPITRAAGFLVLLALLRWKQPEARLLLAVACVPQTSSWYETLLPLLVARTKREMQVMVFASGIGYLMQILLLDQKHEIATTDVGVLIVVFIYLPALAVVLRRPNEGDLPAWMLAFRRGQTS